LESRVFEAYNPHEVHVLVRLTIEQAAMETVVRMRRNVDLVVVGHTIPVSTLGFGIVDVYDDVRVAPAILGNPVALPCYPNGTLTALNADLI
jgi:hypothetical protein